MTSAFICGKTILYIPLHLCILHRKDAKGSKVLKFSQRIESILSTLCVFRVLCGSKSPPFSPSVVFFTAKPNKKQPRGYRGCWERLLFSLLRQGLRLLATAAHQAKTKKTSDEKVGSFWNGGELETIISDGE